MITPVSDSRRGWSLGFFNAMKGGNGNWMRVRVTLYVFKGQDERVRQPFGCGMVPW